MRKIYALLLILFLVFTTAIAQKATFTTVQNGDWHTASTWGGAVPPNLSANTIIVAHDVTVSANFFGYGGTITINSGASLDHSGGFFGELLGTGVVNGTLKTSGGTIYGNTLTVNGIFEWAQNGGSTPASISWGSSSVLKLSGITNAFPVVSTATGSYNDLEIDCSGLTANVELLKSVAAKFSDVIITNTGSFAVQSDKGDESTYADLSIGASGKFIITDDAKINVSGTLTNSATASDLLIESSSSGTGSLISNSSGVSGTFEQYIKNSRWYLVSPPFSGIDSYDFWDNTNDAYLRPYISPGGGWGSYYGNPAVGLNVGEGYELWETANFKFSETGTFITGDQTLSISPGGAVDAGWNLIGNPYPCGIDWAEVQDKTNVDGSSFYVYNGTSYKSHNGTSGTATNSIIPAMQGFFVKRTTAGASSITIKNDDKAHAGIELYKSTAEIVYSNHFKIKASFGEQESVCVLYQQDDATNGADAQYDAPLLFNNDPNFMEVYSLAGEKKSCINIYNDYPYVVNLGLRVPEGGGEFEIQPFDYRKLDGAFSILLEDLETGDIIDLVSNPVYSLNILDGGTIENRLVLHLNSTVGINDNIENNTQVYSNRNRIYFNVDDDQYTHIRVLNIMGQLVYEKQISGGSGLQSVSLNEPTGYYMIQLFTDDKSITKKLYIAK